MTTVNLNQKLYNKINIILKYQNCLLLKIIAEENNWDLDELKKKYLKDNIKEKMIEVIKPEEKRENTDYKFCRKIKIKIKKPRSEKCYKYLFKNKEYFINPKNNNAYDMKGNFLGIKEYNSINFDMEEIE